MRKLAILTIFFLTFFQSNILYSQDNAMGCLIPDHDTAMVLKKKFPVSRSGLPVKYSLLEYAPPAGNQNPYPNCTSWSTAYCAFTIVDRISSSNRYAEPFSAMDLHNRIMAYDGNQTCESGAAISTALHLLSQYGCLRSKSIGCSNVSATVNYPSKLYDYANVTVNVDDIKSAIVQKCPVVIAVETFSDDWQKSEYRPNNVWNGYYSGKTYKYHAMTVIGYDNNFAGGAFLVQNSWGDNWGENGRFWIRYRDITLVTTLAYAVYPHPDEVSYDEDVVEEDEEFEGDEEYEGDDEFPSDQIIRDPDPRKDYANVFFDSRYTLFDLWTDEPIFPENDGKYRIYHATNERKVPVYFNGFPSELEKLVAYKFKNYENCKNWCDGKIYRKNEDDSEKPKGKYFRVWNNCNSTTYLAVAQEIDGLWVSEGWYAISANESRDLSISGRTANKFYYYAQAKNSNGQTIYWSNDESGGSFCIDEQKAFTIYQSYECAPVVGFHVMNPTDFSEYQVVQLSCPSVSSRGSSTSVIPKADLLQMSPKDSEDANLNWDGQYELMDLYSGKNIDLSSSNDDHEIFYVEGLNVKRFKGNHVELAKLKAYKFSNRFNAEKWLEMKSGK
jgi:uncharacterized membrane protein